MKYFYSPFDALYMAMHHGMSFSNPFHISADYTVDDGPYKPPQIDFSCCPKVYLSEMSVKMLEPKIGDTVIDINLCKLETVTERNIYPLIYKIILRDMTPFLWPELEK